MQNIEHYVFSSFLVFVVIFYKTLSLQAFTIPLSVFVLYRELSYMQTTAFNNYLAFFQTKKRKPIRILLIVSAYNSMTQRFHVELLDMGHEVSIELALSDRVIHEAVDLFQPELIVAPFLKRAIPTDIWQKHLCIIIHPGIKGDRGPSSIDWAILNDEPEWGVTALQADLEMDAGDIWASVNFPRSGETKSDLYRVIGDNLSLNSSCQEGLRTRRKKEVGRVFLSRGEWSNN